ncbi:MAG: hypothetical protein JSW39_15680, partial [Desulfobacterales bacterium]
MKLPVAAAFHSELVKQAREPFKQIIGQVHFTPSDIPVFSNTTGASYPFDAEAAQILLGEHLTRPVDFVGEIENLHRSGVDTFVEVGPKSVLTGLIKSILKGRSFQAIAVDAAAGKASGLADLAQTLCQLAARGYPVALRAWEQPFSVTRPQRISVAVSGANYRRPKTEDEAQKTERRKLKPEVGNSQTGISCQESAVRSPKSEDRDQEVVCHRQRNDNSGPPAESQGKFAATQAPALNLEIEQPRSQVKSHASPVTPISGNQQTMEKDSPQRTAYLVDALKVVQEGLKSMQALQTQTAQTHQKFLEAQTEASRTLQAMMENTRRLAEAAFGLPAEFNALDVDAPSKSQALPENLLGALNSQVTTEVPGRPEQPQDQQNLWFPPEKTAPPAMIALESQNPTTHAATRHKKAERPDNAPDEIETNLLEVVSHLTGYPVEMLDRDMDIESDLGIDSIKRVEILATLEEKMPGLPNIAPESMGTLKTLGQIVAYLVGVEERQAAASPPPAANSGRNSSLATPGENTISSDGNHQAVESTLLEVVSQLTGYPVEMLDRDMDIESDLGIDSIKRVEILA